MRLSIVTVSFNVEQCIEKTILSVYNQTLPVYEYIIIDGGSTDSTVDIIKTYEAKFVKKGILFQYISEKDRGISDAFDKGILRATGDLVGLLNADDELLPNTCSILSKEYSKVSADIYYGNCIWEENENHLVFVSKPKVTSSDKLYKLLYNMVLIHPSTFITRKAYNEFGTYDISYKYCMDQELLFRMYKNKARFRYIDKEFTRFKAGGVSDSFPKKVFAEASRIAIDNGEPLVKVKIIEYLKLLRDFSARKAKKIGIYKWIKKKPEKE